MTHSEISSHNVTAPHLVTEIPGPRSVEMSRRLMEHTAGLSSQARLFPVTFVRGSGVTLIDIDDNRYLDFSSGIYVTSLGHCHPRISDAVAEHAHQLMNCHDFPTPVRVELQEALAQVCPPGLGLFQFFDSGTAAVEAALRVARIATGRRSFVGFGNGFHGKTLAAASLGAPDVWKGIRAQDFYRVPAPYPYRSEAPNDVSLTDYILEAIRATSEASGADLAAVLIEPIQGWGGSVVPPDDFLPRLRGLCDELGSLLVADEVLTGFARTGPLFAVEHWGVRPDIMTMGKGFGNGFPVTAIAVRSDLRSAMNSASSSTSYGGNPMACAAALASLKVIEDEGICEHVTAVGGVLLDRLAELQKEHEIIGEVRGKGFLMGIELVKDRATKEPYVEAGTRVYREAGRRGIAWVPAGHILRLAPPLVMSEQDGLRGIDIIEDAIRAVERELGYG
jgi:4-aminobutyrate aminotransferase-like enzyme